MLAYDYPLLGFFWTMFIVFLWFAWLMLLFRVIADLFRTHDMGGLSKALWALFVIVVPYLGVFIYLIVRGRSMGERETTEREAAFHARVRRARGLSGGAADEIARLADLNARGVLTDAEFAQEKAKLLR